MFLQTLKCFINIDSTAEGEDDYKRDIYPRS